MLYLSVKLGFKFWAKTASSGLSCVAMRGLWFFGGLEVLEDGFVGRGGRAGRGLDGLVYKHSLVGLL